MSKPPFQQLVDSHWRDVARYAYGLAGPDGEDIAQQAWAKALDAYPSIKTTKNLRGWIMTITHRCAMDHFRRAKRSPTTIEVLAPGQWEPTRPGADAQLPDTELWAALRALPERPRMAVCLKFLADLDHQAISTHMDVSPEMSRRLVSDGLKQLRLTYQQEGA